MAAKKGTKTGLPFRPYKSYLFVSGTPASLAKSAAAMVTNLVTALDGARDVKSFPPVKVAGARFSCVTYAVESDPPWHMSPTPSERDVLHHIVVVGAIKNLAAICCSDATLREKLFRKVHKGATGMTLVGDEKIKTAFVEGKAKTLWLSGAHRRTTVKADSKVLAGQDLRDALNPLEDQSYYFTSARMEMALGKGPPTTVGVSPSGSRAWLAPSRDWADFCSATEQLLKRLSTAKPTGQNALPVLAKTTGSLASVAGAFDVMLEGDETVANQASAGTDLASRVRLAVTNHKGMIIEVDARDDVGSLGAIEFEMKAVDASGHVTSEIRSKKAVGLDQAREALHKELVDAFEDGRRVKLYFDSGHNLADGRLIEVQFRDHPFAGYEWEPWGGYDVTREKPSSLSNIGNENSLFDWAYKKWSTGYLCCDDGAGELADFLSFASGPNPVVRLIHAKGSGRSTQDRELSVADYEVVVAQALKNLRWLERANAVEKLKAVGKTLTDLVWKDGTKVTRASALAALKTVGSSARFEVCIIQPRLTKMRHDEVRGGGATRERERRLQRLDALLNSADLAVRGLNATLKVYVDAG